jgi:hypothetical protein
MFFRKNKGPQPGQEAASSPTPGAGFHVRVLTDTFLLTGYVEEQNAFLGWLNNPNKRTVELKDVRGLPLAANSAVPAGFEEPEVVLPKECIVAIDMVDQAGQAAVQMSQRREPALIYTDRFAIEAHLHPTGDMPVQHIFNIMGETSFFPTSDAEFHPLIPTRQFPEPRAAVLIVNREKVEFYHAIS